MNLGKSCEKNEPLLEKFSQIFLVMRLTVILMLGFFIQASAGSNAQTVSLNRKNMSLIQIFQEFRKQTGYDFFYTYEQVEEVGRIDVKLKNVPLPIALDSCLKGKGLTYVMLDKMIVIKRVQKKLLISKSDSSLERNFIEIIGKVTNEEGNPLEGVSIVIKGTKNGTITNIKGEFKLGNVPSNSILIVSRVGYQPKEIEVGNKTHFEIVLKVLINTLDETVVIGYGSLKRRDLTGAISSVPKTLLDNTTFSDIGQAIQGQIAGVNILTGDGSPGEPVQVSVRGINSFLGNTSPLLVVDEVPMPSDFNFYDLNPNDISSIDVLKGASASAIYGSRAASGVILISTKRGRFNEKPTIDYSYNIGIDQFTSKIDVLTENEWKYLLFEGVKNQAIADGQTDIESSVHWKNYTAPGFFKEGYNTNWQKEMMQASTLQTHNLSIRGGSANSSFSGTLGFTNDQGVMKKSGFKRYNVNLDLNNKISSKLTSDLNIRANFTNRDIATASVYDAILGRPDYPAYNDDGTPFTNIYYLVNGEPRLIESPISKLLDNIDNVQSHLIGLSGYLQYDFLKNLSFRSRVNYNLDESKTKLYFASTTIAGSGTGFTKAGSLTDTRNSSTQMEWENQLNYSYQYRNHKINLTAVTSFLQENKKLASISFDDFPDDHIQNEFYQGATYRSSSGYNNRAAMISFVGRLNYSFKEKYLLTASVRRDGSSKFSPINAYGTFPSVAVAWNIIKEPFFKNIYWVNFLKLRAGVGKTGMADVGYYAWRTLYGATDYNGASGVIPIQAGNDGLRWESTNQMDLGMDFQLFNSRLSGSIGYYFKKTNGLLYPFTLAPSTGFTNATVNFAKVNNQGFDIEVQLDVIRKKDLIWTFGLNFNNNKNKVTELDKDYITSTSGSQTLANTIVKEGEPFGLIYGFKTDGIYKAWDKVFSDQALDPTHNYQRYMFPGEIRFVDLNGDGWVDVGVANPIGNVDRTILGHSLPDYSGGFSSFITFKQWGLRITGSYSVGNDKVWVQELYSFTQAVPAQPRNSWKIALDRWTPQNPNSKYPSYRVGRTTIAREFNDYNVHKASLLKIQNLQLLYNFKEDLLSRLKLFSAIQIYVSVNNLYVFTKYPGLNPESYSQDDRIEGASLDNSLYPAFRTFNFGLKTTLK